ncbi:prephenate dehydrogenase [Acidicapsa acidisoli]|uniref:prephenate dehydrogenase n=1 Tax=Acidicapsa acidisoli TaxID=1615681 RepID=UPI0021DFD635|nr:prephenate dehydrogenase/arogenate dehydrogenase family protein [Acidicapsa acidisoli]
MIERILILGTGLLGASTGLALRAAGFTGSIIGWDKDPGQAQEALARRSIDSVAANALTAAEASQLILLATPVYAILDWMEQLAPILGPSHLITDVGSTKALISQAGNRLFNDPGRAGFLPGHPMAGKEVSGAAQADAGLFQGAVWIFTSESESESAKENPPVMSFQSAELAASWRKWVEAIGCRTLDLEAKRHDELVAWVSHLPQFLATALTALLQTELGNAPELTAVGGRALREMTRLGSSPYSMWRDVALTNTEAVAAALQALEQRLAHLRENLRTPELRDEFDLANRFRKG